jgi:1,4-dihydroxy-2-naphthoyl-CoA synthase
MTSEVTYQLRNGVAWLNVNRPGARNSLNTAVRDGLVAGVRWFNDDDAKKVLVLTGAGAARRALSRSDLSTGLLNPTTWRTPTRRWPSRSRRTTRCR